MTDNELKEIIITQNEDFEKSNPEYVIREKIADLDKLNHSFRKLKFRLF